MPEQNLDVYKRALDAFDRGDRDTWIAIHHDECELIPSSTWPEADVVRGPEANWDFYVRVTEPFEPRPYSETAGYEVLGDDRILGHQHAVVRGAASGAPAEMDYWILITFRDQKVIREEWFLTREEALEAAGVRG